MGASEYLGWNSHERTDNPAAVAAWRGKYERVMKLEVVEQLAVSCGYGAKLVQYWGKERMVPQAVEFFEACKLFYEYGLSGYFISGTVLEDWYANDWRGKKEQVPTPTQLFERALMVQSRLERELEADNYRAPITARSFLVDDNPELPMPTGRVKYD